MRALSTQNVSLRKVVISSSDMPARAIVDVVRRFLVDHLSTSSYHLSTKTAAARGAMREARQFEVVRGAAVRGGGGGR